MSFIIGANSAVGGGGYNVANGVRFDDGSSSNFTDGSAPAGNRQKFTWSAWFKRSSVGATQILASSSHSGSDEGYLFLSGGGVLGWQSNNSGDGDLTTAMLWRDLSAWYHVVFSVDTTQSTSTNRIKLYVNGSQYTWDGNTTQPNQNQSLYFNVGGNYNTYIGRRAGGDYYDGYMSEIVFIDNAQLAADSFGEFDSDSGIWKPLESVADLTFGTSGYYLNFQDSAALGDDVSGNGNDFTVNNLTAIDQTTDTCTNNFATLNFLYPTGGGFDNQSGATFEEGNTKFTTDNGDADWGTCVSSIAVSSGKWYVEMKKISGTGGVIGIRGTNSDNDNGYIGRLTHGVGYQQSGDKRIAGTQSTYGDTWTTNDIIGVALDLDNNKLYFSKNGTFQDSGDPTSGATGTGAISVDAASSTVLGVYYIGATEINSSGNGTFNFNFGNPSFSISSGNTDGNGYGNFEYAVPSGYYALCTKNLGAYGG